VLEELQEWHRGRWTAVYPVLLIDAMVPKVRDDQVVNRPVAVLVAVPTQTRACRCVALAPANQGNADG
jgi:transposase-like protein